MKKTPKKSVLRTPVGTTGHEYIMRFDNEHAAFRAMVAELGLGGKVTR